MLSAPHAAFVIVAYALSGLVIAGLVLDTLLRSRRWKAKAGERDRNRPA